MNINIKRIAATALGAAIICIFTAFIQIPISNGTGYIHPGDCFIYFFACLLPMPYGIFAASIGAALADIISGYAIYALPTFIIKAAMAVWFTNKKNMFSVRNMLVLIPSTIVLVGGYYLAEVIMYGSAIALFNASFTAIQGVANAAFFIVLSIILSKTKAYNTLKEELY